MCSRISAKPSTRCARGDDDSLEACCRQIGRDLEASLFASRPPLASFRAHTLPSFTLMKNRLLVLALLLAASWSTAMAAPGRRIVFMIGEDQYNTAETLPELAATELKPRGYEVTVINVDATDKNSFPSLEAALPSADLLLISVRRKTPPKEQLDAIRAYLAAGKPLVGLRTACHAFALRPRDKLADPRFATWQEFDPEVLGGHYTDHHKAGPAVTFVVAPGARENRILQGVRVGKLATVGSLYKVSPLAIDAMPLLIGSVDNQPPEPVAWTRSYGPKHARIFFTSLGTPDDFRNPDFRRLLVNGIEWSLGK
jgi:type 1 glutamine amidotransferase